jgi:hypothetical protein
VQVKPLEQVRVVTAPPPQQGWPDPPHTSQVFTVPPKPASPVAATPRQA